MARNLKRTLQDVQQHRGGQQVKDWDDHVQFGPQQPWHEAADHACHQNTCHDEHTSEAASTP
jgi:hypothetical protein